jgi:Domain of unknown function (DUF5710)
VNETRVWLDVPFNDKEAAKAFGARWDPAARRWYAPRAGIVGLQPWAALPDCPTLLPGEDRAFGSGLYVDLVPTSCWFTNVRSCVIPKDWERLRRMITARAGQQCEACGRGEDRPSQRWLEAHERWEYDEPGAVQSLRRLICLCTDCHTVTHFGLAQIQGHGPAALAHLRTVTGMSAAQADMHINKAAAQWRARSAQQWTLDLSILTSAGITLAPPPDRADRPRIAQETLAPLRQAATTTAQAPAVSAPPATLPRPSPGPRPITPLQGKRSGGGLLRWFRQSGRKS